MAGEFVTLDGEAVYCISDVHMMAPFMMTIPSATDIWLFVSSRGGLTAGRVDPDKSLFAYETEDRLHDLHNVSGPFTTMRVRRGDVLHEWSPFASDISESRRRNLYKSVNAESVTFEEIDDSLGLAFRYRWQPCEELGLVRTASLTNLGDDEVEVDLVDGFRNVQPFGVPLGHSQWASSLVDAYKRTERDPETGMAIFSLTSKITDRPEPAEVLKANCVWSRGLEDGTVLLSTDQVDTFRRGGAVVEETLVTGRRGAYLVAVRRRLEGRGTAEWLFGADVGLSHLALARLKRRLAAGTGRADVLACLEDASRRLFDIVAHADGVQTTASRATTVHHFTNVLFNVMRGGVPVAAHAIPSRDLADFIRQRNLPASRRSARFLESLPEVILFDRLLEVVREHGDADLERLCHEYIPLWGGRRHGDPSRPWNRFNIRTKAADGSPALSYEGNWRDIFQNWEALAWSFPGFCESVVAKFVNASTVDGFNPYHISRDGIDWEVPHPEDPTATIGYWGDHQIIYLTRLMELSRAFRPRTLRGALTRPVYSYANVPYRIGSYEELLADPRSTIHFDHTEASRIEERIRTTGSDGKLLLKADSAIHLVNLAEKLVVPALSKICNLVLDGGIWMNTQRPEWNDANNALVGNGLSVVTLCHLRRYLDLLRRLFGAPGNDEVELSSEVAAWVHRVRATLTEHRPLLDAPPDPTSRRHLLDALGQEFSGYRARVYARGLSGGEPVAFSELVDLCRTALAFVDRSITSNRRDDGLYHSYNLLEITGSEARIAPLHQMLEGQVAAIASGLPTPREVTGIVEALFESRLYLAERNSFLLYPERDLPSFTERNAVPQELIASSPLIASLLDADDTSIVARDAGGVVRFHGAFENAGDLEAALDALGRDPTWADPVAVGRAAVGAVFEAVFDHGSFTGRSGAMYSYEGIGCIYWQMVAKLLRTVQETYIRAVDDGEPGTVTGKLADQYRRIRDGLAPDKTPEEFGAFPTDAHSHTPRHGGARQPGMTGQVKERIITRLHELGVLVRSGKLAFRPELLAASELLTSSSTLTLEGREAPAKQIPIAAGSLAFTFCGVPVVYSVATEVPTTTVTLADGSTTEFRTGELDVETSRAVFARSGKIKRIDVTLDRRALQVS